MGGEAKGCLSGAGAYKEGASAPSHLEVLDGLRDAGTDEIKVGWKKNFANEDSPVLPNFCCARGRLEVSRGWPGGDRHEGHRLLCLRGPPRAHVPCARAPMRMPISNLSALGRGVRWGAQASRLVLSRFRMSGSRELHS